VARTQWPSLEPISPAGRIAGYTTTICASVAGLAYLVIAGIIVECVHSCRVTPALGGLLFLFVAPPTAWAIWEVRHVARRPRSPDGSSAWRFGLGVLFAFGVAAGVSRFPDATCPAGFRLFVLADKCIGAQHALMDPTSWVWAKDLTVLAGVLLGATIMRSRRYVRAASGVAALAWIVGMGMLGFSLMTGWRF
jgi:hypothetical protein